MTLKIKALNYIKEARRKVAKGEIQRWVAETTTYTPENVGRRLRELENANLIKVSYEKNHAFYEYVEPEKKTLKIIGNRDHKEITLKI